MAKKQKDIGEIKSLGRKLRALAKGGVDGEKNSARDKYLAFLEKHGLEDWEIDPSSQTRRFKMKNEDSRIVMYNIIASINPYAKFHVDEKTNTIIVDLDDEDFKEAKEKGSYFVKLFNVEKELLHLAFATKHKYYYKADHKAMKKWREKKTESDILRKSQEDLQAVIQKWENDINRPPQTADSAIALSDLSSIQTFNVDRVSQLTEILLEANYRRNNIGLD